jgi:uncharacterized phage-associated protein
MALALDVAKYFLTLSEPDEGDVVTHLKLQKLCYYAQGSALAVLGRPLFDEQILAWEHGPVVREVWEAYRQYASGAIPVPADFDAEAVLTAEERELLDEVWNVYGQFSAWKLRNLTHEESPWANAVRDAVIPHEALRTFFRTRVVA